MEQPKFTLNSLIIVTSIFMAMTLFFSVTIVNMADWAAVNDYYEIEGTDLGILYSDIKPSGIYRGSKNAGTLVLEGNFSHDWGIVKSDGRLYLNEYRSTAMGIMTSRLMQIDLDTLEADVVLDEAVLRGACRSGELVCLAGAMLPSNRPETNVLCKLYGMTSEALAPGGEASIVFVDPKTGEVVWRVDGVDASGEDFEGLYLERSLEEIR